MNLLTFTDLCAGIGGFRLALEKNGMNCIYSCEIDSDCAKTYSANHHSTYDEKDIFNINLERFPHSDILCSGFPCQPFSLAGKKQGFNDDRGEIFFQLAKLIESSRPKVVFLENVPNILKINDGEVMKTIISKLENLNYNVFYEVLDSADFGIAQSRKRLYIIAVERSFYKGNFLFTKKRKRRISIESIINTGDYSIPISEKWENYIKLYTNKITQDEIDFEVPKTRKKLERIDPGTDLENCILQIRSSGIRAISINSQFPTFAVSISGGGAMIPVYTKERRHLNLIEMKRLMGFPDNFIFPVSRTSSIKQLANSVCPPVIESICLDLKSQIFNMSEIFS